MKLRNCILVFLAAVPSSCHSPISDLERARRDAHVQEKVLMVQFGAGWCPECRVLSKELDNPRLHGYMEQHFVLLDVDVGEFDRNMELAKSVGLDVVQSGIPAAAFFTPDGAAILTTQHGELARASQEGSESLHRFFETIRQQASPRFPQPSF